jgi:poly-gamma-glutamate capsule biosynthesis protein CapA/YwtB (metallophosphatase superfamily)
MKKLYIVLILIFIPLLVISSEVTIGFVGDIMLGRQVGKFLKHTQDYTYPWGNLLPLLRSIDFNVGNLETTLTKSRKKAPKAFNFKSNPANAQALNEANFLFVNLANNHILDFGIPGLKETLATLNDHEIIHAGAGLSSAQAQKAHFITKNNSTFAFLSATDNEPSWAAGIRKAGISFMEFNENNAQALSEQIKELKKTAQFIIVSVHWGPNWDSRPRTSFQKFAHQILDAGADLIHGHSPHIFQGIELYHDKLIIYSAGDFLDDYSVDEALHNDQSFLFLTTFDEQGLKELRLIPVKISNFQVNKAPYREAQTMLLHLQKLSLELGTVVPRNGIWQRKK